MHSALGEIYDHSLLYYATFEDFPGVVSALLEAKVGAKAELMDGCQQTPLHWAGMWNREKAFLAILEAGVDPGLEDQRGKTAVECLNLNRVSVYPDIREKIVNFLGKHYPGVKGIEHIRSNLKVLRLCRPIDG